MLADELVLENLDEALRSVLDPACRAMDRLFSLGFQPVGDIPTLTLALGIFVWRYNECREMGVTIPDSLTIAQGSVLSNPNVSKHLASKGFHIINNAAGVSE
jgi:hypothetical protein